MAAMVSFASSLRCKSVGDLDRRETVSSTGRDRDGTGDSEFSAPFTPYTLQTRKGRQTPPPLPQRGKGHVSPVGQYIRRSIYTPEESAPAAVTPRSTLAPSSGRTNSHGQSKSPQSVRVKAAEAKLPPKSDHGGGSAWRDSSHIGVSSARLSSPPVTNAAKRSDFVRLEQCLLSTEKGWSALKSELRRVGSPYAVTPEPGENLRGRSTSPGHSARTAVHDRGGARKGAAVCAALTTARSPAARGRQVARATPRSQPPVERAERLSKSVPPRSDAAVKKPAASSPSDMRRTVVRETSRRVTIAREEVSPAGVSSAKVRESFLPRQRPRPSQRGNMEMAGLNDPSPTLEAVIPDDEKKRFRAAWKEAHAQLAAKMNEWVHGLPEEIRIQVTKAPGVDAKFLALRDCVLALCTAAESRAESLLEARARNDESKRSLKTEQYKAGTMLVEVQGGLLAATKKIQQLDRLVRLTVRQRPFSEQRVKSTHDSGSAAAGGASPYTSYTSIYKIDLPQRGGSHDDDYPVPVDDHQMLGVPSADESLPPVKSIQREEGVLATDGQQHYDSTPVSERAIFINEEDATVHQNVQDAARICDYSPHTPRSATEGTGHPSFLSSEPPCTSSVREGANEMGANKQSLTPLRQLSGDSGQASAELSLSGIPPEGATVNEDVSWARSFISEWYAHRR
uniref:Uncharacterized protein n=1 Tax=Neospora caninum (strain Liverpool) TaxID=572307 RepID=A0A0F7U9V6_NEOCL|nr:TPA: hypothetical protein BN1204_024986 [Neospora caninum Liverpool]